MLYPCISKVLRLIPYYKWKSGLFQVHTDLYTMNAVVLLIAGMSVCVSVRADDTYVVGGLGPTKFATEEVQDLVDLVFSFLFLFFFFYVSSLSSYFSFSF